MSPEILIAIVSAFAALLLIGGGVLVGQARRGKHDADRMTELEGDVEIARKQVREAERECANAKREQQATAAELETLRAGVESRATNAAEASVERDAMARDLQQARQELDQIRLKLTSSEQVALQAKEIREKAERVDKEREQLLGRIKSLEEEKARTAHATKPPPAADASARVADLEKTLREARDEATRLRGDIASRDDRLQKIQASLEAQTAETAMVAKERDDCKERMEALERLIEGVRARSSSISQQLKDAQAELAKLKSGK